MVASLVAALAATLSSSATFPVVFSAGFSTKMVLQRSATAGAAVYGFVDGDAVASIVVSVSGVDGKGGAVEYSVPATATPQPPVGWFPDTNAPPAHGAFVWRATLKPADAGGSYKVKVTDSVKSSASLLDVTFGDVWLCSGQSNMALETYYTFSADALKAEVVSEKQWSNVRHFMMGSMGNHYEATTPQFVTVQNSVLADNTTFVWHKLSDSAKLPSKDSTSGQHSAFAQFSSTCMYFAVELIAALGDTTTPIGIIQSAIGGSQIEAWMDNKTLTQCSHESLAGGAVPGNSGRLFYGMIAPFVNMSLSGFLWYQGENNVYGTMGNSAAHTGYACELPAMVASWRSYWRAAHSLSYSSTNSYVEPLFGVATLAAGGSEGNDRNMASMRMAQTASYGVLPNPIMPHSFLAQVYDIGDPWAFVGDGGSDKQHCALTNPNTSKFGSNCSKWDPSKWSPGVRAFAPLVRENAPSGVRGNNFMGGIHPRLKRPVGRRLAVAAAALLKGEVMTGPTIVGCTSRSASGSSKSPSSFTIHFNASLLAGDSISIATKRDGSGTFDLNFSAWSHADSLGAMACFAPPPPPPPSPTPLTCEQKCSASGHCCTGLSSADQQPSCAQGCAIAALAHSTEECKRECARIPHNCTVKYKNITIMTCAAACGWTPSNPAPPGLSPFASCNPGSPQGCEDACDYAAGAPPKPLFPTRNATTCACRSWGSVPCDGGKKGATGQWPCASAGESIYWYCVDGPGWKPPVPMIARAERLRHEEVLNAHRLNARGISTPRAPGNPYASLWTSVPLKAALSGSDVQLDLSSSPALKDRAVLAIRYGWALADGGDTCCPQENVNALGLAACIPASCPLLSAKSQLPPNPFFATVDEGSGKCRCAAPQVCDA